MCAHAFNLDISFIFFCVKVGSQDHTLVRLSLDCVSLLRQFPAKTTPTMFDVPSCCPLSPK